MSGHAGSGHSVSQEGGQAMRGSHDGGGEAADLLSAAEAETLHRVFLEACHLATNHKSRIADVPNQEKLRLYGYYKQAKFGDCKVEKPSFLSFSAVAKWEAWSAMQDMTKERAKLEYITLVISLDPDRSEHIQRGIDLLLRTGPRGKLVSEEGGEHGRKFLLKKRIQFLSEIIPSSNEGSVASLRTHESESNVSSGARGSKSSSAHHSPLPPSHIPQPAASPPRANSHKSIAWEDGRTGGLHIFFIWVDPRSPLDNTLEEWPLPGKYAETVSQWRDRYSGADVQVYSGLDCLRFVEEVDRKASADCAGLLDVYLELATINNWIKMVDIARVAIMYLKGGLYLDTDMELGPRTFDHEQLYDARCWMVQDSEAIVQNHLFRAPPGHAFLSFLLKVYLVNVFEEAHVVQATGPCAVTSSLRLYDSNGAWPPADIPTAQDLNGEEQVTDFFTTMEIQRLAFNIRSRLRRFGYGEDVMRPEANGKEKGISLHPPAAFYTHHWREDPEEASNRSREGCYAVHMWDTTWAPKQRTARRGYMWGDAYLAGVGYFAPKQRGYCLWSGYTSELVAGNRTGSWGTETAMSRHSSAQLGSDVCLSAGELINRWRDPDSAEDLEEKSSFDFPKQIQEEGELDFTALSMLRRQGSEVFRELPTLREGGIDDESLIEVSEFHMAQLEQFLPDD